MQFEQRWTDCTHTAMETDSGGCRMLWTLTGLYTYSRFGNYNSVILVKGYLEKNVKLKSWYDLLKIGSEFLLKFDKYIAKG